VFEQAVGMDGNREIRRKAKWYLSSAERDHRICYALQNRCGHGDEDKNFVRGASRVAGFRPLIDIFENKL
jgi:hypothetical protein